MLKSIYQQKIASKRADLIRLQEFKQLTEQLANQLEQVGDLLETMKDGAESVALILANWQNVIKSISLASLGLMKSQGEVPLPESLVRVRLDKDEPVVENEQEEEDNEQTEKNELYEQEQAEQGEST